MGVPPVIIHFLMGFSLSKTNQLLGIPMTMETARAGLVASDSPRWCDKHGRESNPPGFATSQRTASLELN